MLRLGSARHEPWAGTAESRLFISSRSVQPPTVPRISPFPTPTVVTLIPSPSTALSPSLAIQRRRPRSSPPDVDDELTTVISGAPSLLGVGVPPSSFARPSVSFGVSVVQGSFVLPNPLRSDVYSLSVVLLCCVCVRLTVCLCDCCLLARCCLLPTSTTN